MKRILLKLSGEALAGEKGTGFDEAVVTGVAKQVKELSSSKGKGHTKEVALVILAAVTAVVILVALLVLKLPVLPVILIVAIEIAMGACLQKVPLWLHGAVVAAQIVVGALTGNVVFFLLGGGLYFIGVLSIGLVFFSSRRTKAHAG